jgi:hypothetical protein
MPGKVVRGIFAPLSSKTTVLLSGTCEAVWYPLIVESTSTSSNCCPGTNSWSSRVLIVTSPSSLFLEITETSIVLPGSITSLAKNPGRASVVTEISVAT